MTDDDGDIEFLDEDADIVHLCVQSVQSQLAIKIEPVDEEEEPPAHVIQKSKSPTSPLIIERPSLTVRSAPVRKRKKDDDDTDYDPIVDSPHWQFWNRKRRVNMRKLSNTRKLETIDRSNQQSQLPPVYKEIRNSEIVLRKPALHLSQMNRRDITIRIPDYDDPLCLPVRALVKDENDMRRLKHWNQLCLEQLKNNDTPLRPRNASVTSSKRTVVIRNMFNKFSGKTETTFWSKLSVGGKEGDTKSDVVQAVVPRYREKKILTSYKLGEVKRRRSFNDKYQVILTKERNADEETLVAYDPDKPLVMVFKMFDSVTSENGPEEEKRYLQEISSCASCARCYQTSWRGSNNDEKLEYALAQCPVCARSCGAASSLVAHLKTHSPDDVIPHRRGISETLAKVLPYHYRCRVCQQQFSAIRDLRRHLATHRGVGEFYCEVGSHTVS